MPTRQKGLSNLQNCCCKSHGLPSLICGDANCRLDQVGLHMFALVSLHERGAAFSPTEAFTQSSSYTQKRLHREGFIHRSFDKLQHLHKGLLHIDALTQSSFHTHTEVFTHSRFTHRTYHTELTFHTDATQSSLYTETLLQLHRKAFTQREAFTQHSLYTKAFQTQTLLHRDAFTQSSF